MEEQFKSLKRQMEDNKAEQDKRHHEIMGMFDQQNKKHEATMEILKGLLMRNESMPAQSTPQSSTTTDRSAHEVDSTGDDTDKDEDLTVFDDGAGEAYSHDDANNVCNCDDSDVPSGLEKAAMTQRPPELENQQPNPQPQADSRSTVEIGNNNTFKSLSFILKLECPELKNSLLIIAPELFDECSKDEYGIITPILTLCSTNTMTSSVDTSKKVFIVYVLQPSSVNSGLSVIRTIKESTVVAYGLDKKSTSVGENYMFIFDPGGGVFELATSVCNALINMYSMSGMVNDARAVFDDIEDKFSVSWNCMIAGFLINGHNMEALELLNRMMTTDIDLSRLTIVIVLKLCANIQVFGSARQAAIAWALERKPNAFRRMAGQHITLNIEDDAKSLTEGCHCKKSGCLENYCSCFRAYSLCSAQCTCMNCKNLEGNQEQLAFGSGMMASKLTKLDPENLAIAGSVGQSGYQDSANKNDQNLQSLNTADPSPIELEQTHQLVNPRPGDQLLAPTTEGSSKLAYRSLLAGFIQPQDVKELSVFLIVVSEANNDFKEKHYSTNLQAEGENHMLIIDSPANQDVEQSHGLVDQNAKTKYYLQDALVVTSELDPRSCDNDQHNERPVFPGTLELKCDKEDALVTRDNTSNMILDYGWNTIYTEQEKLILVTFRDHLIKLIAHGTVQQRQLSMSDHFGADNQHEAVVLDHKAEP